MKILSDVKDSRRRQGLRYELIHILLFSVFAILSGADSYRKIHSFIEVRYQFLNGSFGLINDNYYFPPATIKIPIFDLP